MSNAAVSLELTAESRELVRTWTERTRKDVQQIEDTWLDRMAAWMIRETLRAFNESQQTGGTRWPLNAGIYAMWKQWMGQDKPGILTGALRRSISREVDKSGRLARVGSPLTYAEDFHNGIRGSRTFTAHGPGGRTLGPITISGSPPRPFLPHPALTQAHGANLFEELLGKKVG